MVKSPDWVRPPGGDEHAPPQAGETGAWRGSSSQRQESRAGDASHAGAAGGPGGGGSRAHAADTARRGAGPGRPGRDRTRRVEGHGSKTTSVSVSWHAGPLTNLAVLGKHPGLPVNDDALRKTRPRAGALTAARTTTETRRERATVSPTTGCGPRAARPCPLLSSYAALCNGPVTGATAASRGETRPPPRPHLPAGACRLAVRGPLLRVVAATLHPAVGPRASAAPLLGRGRGCRDLALSAPGPALHTEHHARDFSFEGKSIPLTVFIVEQNTGAKNQGQHANGTPTAVTTSDQQMAPSAPDSRQRRAEAAA